MTYAPSQENFRNPERGEIISYQPGGTSDGVPANNAPLSDAGVRDYLTRESTNLPSSLVRLVYVLGQWKDASIPQAFLDRIAADLGVARELGLKVAPYFVYSWPLDENAGFDAPKDRILAHLEQLKPVLQGNGDVIAFMLAGFIGPWGEWHHSSNGNLTSADGVNDNARAILNGLLEALPSNRSVLLRYPGLKYQFFDKTPLSAQEAFSQTARSRVGFHDECYMADYHPDVRAIRLANRAFLQQEGLYVPQAEMMDSGCFDFPYAVWKAVPCADLLEEMSSTHPDATNQFPANRVTGDCLEEARRRTGYRYRLLDSETPASVGAGAALRVDLSLTNDGFGSIYNPRGLEIVLREKTTGEAVRLKVNTAEDVRALLPAPGQTKKLALIATLPASLPPGQYALLLNLPDPAPSLLARPEYSIRLANQGMWEPTTGWNALNATLEVKP